MNDDELREQLALYAVGALTDDERTELEDVLRTRPDLQAELTELEEGVAILADAVTETPPPTLRASILDLIAATPQEPAAPEAPIAPVVPIGSGRKRNRWVAFGAAAAAVAAIAVGVLVVSPWSSNDTSPTAAVLQSDDAQTIEMPGSLPGVTIVHSASQNAAVLQADQVPVPEGDRVYELWAISNGTPERTATFRPDESGRLSRLRPRPRPGQRRAVGDHRGAGRRQRRPDDADPQRHRLTTSWSGWWSAPATTHTGAQKPGYSPATGLGASGWPGWSNERSPASMASRRWMAMSPTLTLSSAPAAFVPSSSMM